MANHSAEAPYGELSYSTIASWFGMTGSPGSYVANQGQEKIPDNWVSQATGKRRQSEPKLTTVLSTNALSHTLTPSLTSLETF